MDAKKRILIIENDNDIRSVYSELLKGAGYEIIESTNAADCKEQTNRGDWDLLLLGNNAQVVPDNSVVKTKPLVLLTSIGLDSTSEIENRLSPNGHLDYLDSSPREVIDMVNSILK